MNEEQKPYKINYVFHIQCPEDFYKMLREYHRVDLEIEQENESDDLALAQNMLRGIGVNV